MYVTTGIFKNTGICNLLFRFSLLFNNYDLDLKPKKDQTDSHGTADPKPYMLRPYYRRNQTGEIYDPYDQTSVDAFKLRLVIQKRVDYQGDHSNVNDYHWLLSTDPDGMSW